MQAAKTFFILALPWLAIAQIPVADPLVVAKCGTCHSVDAHGMMQRLSWTRATPEGWQEVLKRMIREQSVSVTPAEARVIVKYLSDQHGLAPEEAKPVLYYAERRIHDEASEARDPVQANFIEDCAKCHEAARPLSWRRSAEAWKQFAAEHAARYKFKAEENIIRYLSEAAPLTTAAWTAWSARTHTPELTGRWLVTAHMPGQGRFYGEMHVEAGRNEGEFITHVTLHQVKNGSTVIRAGRNVVYAGSAWPGGRKAAVPTRQYPMIRRVKRAMSCGYRPMDRGPKAAGSGASIRNSDLTCRCGGHLPRRRYCW